MFEQGYLTRMVYEQSAQQSLPAAMDIQAPQEPTVEGVDAGYFTSWVRQQVIERYGAPRAFDGGLQIKTTLDLELQRAAEHAIEGYLAYSGGPTASLVAIENSTGEVRAMVGGRSYNESPFNLATEGERQPGSSFKAFDLAGALEDGISPDSTWASKQKEFIVPHTGGHEKFIVHNDEGAYTGSNTLTGATAYSDNSIYAEVGLRVGTERIARLAHRMGITTPISTNPAMTIGGFKVGVTPLDMAHAYETIAHERTARQRHAGRSGLAGRHSGSRLPRPRAPRRLPPRRQPRRHQARAAAGHRGTETSVLETVLQYGTARSAAIGQFAAGKTGTTSNYGDAWFVGWDSKYTVAMWVGYPNGLVPMTTEFNGGPVLGGTFPALIWHDFMTSAMRVDKTRAEQAVAQAAARAAGKAHGQSTTSPPKKRLALRGPVRARLPPAKKAPSERHAARTRAGAAAAKHGSPSATPAPSSPPAPAAPARQKARRRPKGRWRRWRRRLGSYGRSQRQPVGRGRDTWRLPATQKRQGNSTAFVIPTRLPATIGSSPAHRRGA